jgi:hypothetical protein
MIKKTKISLSQPPAFLAAVFQILMYIQQTDKKIKPRLFPAGRKPAGGRSLGLFPAD